MSSERRGGCGSWSLSRGSSVRGQEVGGLRKCRSFPSLAAQFYDTLLFCSGFVWEFKWRGRIESSGFRAESVRAFIVHSCACNQVPKPELSEASIQNERCRSTSAPARCGNAPINISSSPHGEESRMGENADAGACASRFLSFTNLVSFRGLGAHLFYV